MPQSVAHEVRAAEPDQRIVYLELDVLWSDHGPVARLLLRNASSIPTFEQVQVYAEHGRDRRRGGRLTCACLPARRSRR